jgi:hypothetical protein
LYNNIHTIKTECLNLLYYSCYWCIGVFLPRLLFFWCCVMRLSLASRRSESNILHGSGHSKCKIPIGVMSPANRPISGTCRFVVINTTAKLILLVLFLIAADSKCAFQLENAEHVGSPPPRPPSRKTSHCQLGQFSCS